MNMWEVNAPPATDALFFNAARRTTFLLVEGGSDQRFWAARIDRQRCQIRDMKGRDLALRELETVQRESKGGFVAVLDADFDRVDGTLAVKPNVAWTDYHDLEVVLIASPALDRVLVEVASSNKVAEIEKAEGRSVRDILLAEGLGLARLRFVSRQRNLGLTFRKPSEGSFRYLAYSAFCDKATWKVDLAKLVQEVLNFSNQPKLKVPDLLDAMAGVQSSDSLQLCVGHDLVGLLMVGLRKNIGDRSLTIEELEERLRLALHKEDLERTQMYQQLREWEQQNAPYRIFA